MVIANSKFISYIDASWGGSAIAVIPIGSVGKNHIPVVCATYQQPMIRAHTTDIDLVLSKKHVLCSTLCWHC